MKIKKLSVLPLVLALLLASSGSVSAQQAGPRVAIQLATSGLTSPLAPGQSNAVMARLILDTTGSSESVRISSLPFNLTVGGGGNANMLSDCRVYNESAPTVPLSGGTSTSTATSTSNNLSSGVNNIALNAPLVLSANTVTTLALRCAIGSNLSTGATFTFSMNTANVSAVGASSGQAATVTIRCSATPAPAPQTPAPGLPATGEGGNAMKNVMTIIASIAIAGLALAYTRRNSTKRS